MEGEEEVLAEPTEEGRLLTLLLLCYADSRVLILQEMLEVC